MGKTNKNNIVQEESLSVEVQKYPCLFDKSSKGYKERDRKLNAWKKVEENLGLEEGTAEKRFDTIRKKYNRQKNALKAKNKSGSGSKDVKAEENVV